MRLTIGRSGIGLRQPGAEPYETIRILFQLRQLIFAVHEHDKLKKISRLLQPAEIFITLRQHIPRPAGPQFVTRPFGDGLAGLATGDRIVVALLKQERPADHPPGIGHAALIAQTPHQHERMFVVLNRLIELSAPRDQAEV